MTTERKSLPYEEAKAFIREQMLPSRGAYFDWWEREKPKTLPKYPHRAYEKNWVSWNDFLGTDNKFNQFKPKQYRPFLEAVAWANTKRLKTQEEWLEYCRMDFNDKPEDIPTRPDLKYTEWRGWGHWLGNTPVELVRAQQEIASRIQVFYVTHDPSYPANVLTFGVEPAGLSAMKSRWQDQKFDIVRLFWYDPSKSDQIWKVINTLTTPYMQPSDLMFAVDDETRVVPIVGEVLYYLQMYMTQITARDVK